MVSCAPKWRKILKKKKKNHKNNPLIPTAAVVSRPPLSPLLITAFFPFPEPGKFLYLNPLQRRRGKALLLLLLLLLLLWLLLLLLGNKRERN